jgi:hypothetical protein
MKKHIIYIFILPFLIFHINSFSQNVEELNKHKQVSKLFRSQDVLPVKLSYSIKNIKKNTNDSTYLKTNISYSEDDGEWNSFEVELRVRGFYRLKHCYFPPIKIKIKKSISKGTLFENNKKLKLVLPCLTNKENNDYIVKEYMAYKLYEEISPYHFKTRMVDISFTEDKGKKTKTHDLKGILIEDDKKVAKRHDGKVFKRDFHPISQDPTTSVQNSFFQYMIGNIDFSTAVQHNEKLLFVNSKIIPLPYDFDMSGLVNASYAEVPVIDEVPLVSSVTERLYRGFRRNPKIIQQVRKEFLDNEIVLLEIVDNLEPFFEYPKEFNEAKDYISDFFDVMEDNVRFKKEISSKLRTK